MIKNMQLSSNQADILPKLPIQELIILVKYQLDWKKIVDFLNDSMFFIQSYFLLLIL